MSHTSEPELPADPDLAVGNARKPDTGRRRGQRRGSPRARPGVLAAIALGAALGAPARYGVAQVIHVSANTFPWATFWTNISGSLVLGLFLTLILERFPPSRYLRPFVATGFVGAYTTYSTFAVETDLLVRNGHAVLGLAYGIASLGAGLGAVWAGMWLARLPRKGGGGR